MKALCLVLLVPAALLAQVEVDTVIRLNANLFNGYYIPELNKLYVHSPYRLLAVDCSTYQQVAEFPNEALYGGCAFAWNPLRRKLYVSFDYVNARDSMLVVYADADTARWVSPALLEPEYVASGDLLYGATWRRSDLLALDCKTDSVVKTIPSPIPGLFSGASVTWDPVGDNVYSTVSAWQRPARLAVYDVASDSLLALIALGIATPVKLSFHHRLRKAYFMSGPSLGLIRAGVVATDSLRLIKLFPFSANTYGTTNNGHGSIAVNTRMDEVYFGGHNIAGGGLPTHCTLHIANRKDSIIRKIGFIGRGAKRYVVWVPWSNRVYFDADDRFHMAVLDCATDSLIIPELVLPGQHWAPIDIQLDPVRERIFAISADTTAIHVLRDVPSGVAEGHGPGPRAPAPLHVTPNPARDRVRLAGSETAELYAPDGRRVAALAPGENDVRPLARGVYFVRQSGRGESARLVLVR
jgi:hypothetical protein